MTFPISIFINSASNKNNLTKAQIINLDREEIFDRIQKETWSPYLFNHNKRNKENFKSASIIGIDIDEGLTIIEARKRLDSKKLNYIITLTRHHKIDKGDKAPCDRYRIVLFLKNEITNPKEVIRCLSLIQRKLFPELDKSCLDLARIFFPSTSPENETNAVIISQLEDLDPEIHLTENSLDKILNIPFLPKKIKYFLTSPSEVEKKHEWNDHLNTTAFYLATTGMSEEEILDLLNSIAPSPLDYNDTAAIKSATQAGALKKNEQNDGPQTNRFFQIFQLLRIELNRIHLILTKEGVVNILLENENKEVKYISSKYLKKIVSMTLEKHNLYKSESDLKNLVEYFLDHKEPLNSPPTLISFKSCNDISFKKLDFDPTIVDECPLFKEILSRCSNQQALAAFIWSIFEHKSDRQQYLWGMGNGQDGKGAIGRLLASLLGETYCSEISTSQDDKHFASNFIDKRLVHYPDNNNQNLVTTSVFKMLTGGDAIKINPKGREAFTAKLDLKVLIFSNVDPNISSQKSDQRRIIYCLFSPFTGEPNSQYENNLWKERAAILGYCKSIYEAIVPNNGKIPSELDAALNLATINEENFEFVFDELFYITNNDQFITPNDFKKISNDLLRQNGINYAKFKEWTIRAYALKVDNSSRPRKIFGIQHKNQSNHSVLYNYLKDSTEISNI